MDCLPDLLVSHSLNGLPLCEAQESGSAITRRALDHWGLSYTQNWAGNYADESTPGQTYTEADMDYFVPCIVGTPPGEASAAMGAFIGLGGANTSGPLVQTGTADFQYWDPIRGDFQDIDFEGCVNDNTSAFALAALHESSCAYDGGWRAF